MLLELMNSFIGSKSTIVLSSPFVLNIHGYDRKHIQSILMLISILLGLIKRFVNPKSIEIYSKTHRFYFSVNNFCSFWILPSLNLIFLPLARGILRANEVVHWF